MIRKLLEKQKKQEDELNRLRKLFDRLEEQKIELEEENKELRRQVEFYCDYIIENIKVEDCFKASVETMRREGIAEYKIIHNEEEAKKFFMN